MVPFQSKQWRSVPILPVANQSRHSGGKRQAGLGSLAASNPEEKELFHQANVVGCHVKTGETRRMGLKIHQGKQPHAGLWSGITAG